MAVQQMEITHQQKERDNGQSAGNQESTKNMLIHGFSRKLIRPSTKLTIEAKKRMRVVETPVTHRLFLK